MNKRNATNGKMKIFKAGIGYTVGNILLKGVAFLSTPIFTHLMTTENYGIYSTFMTYEGILAVIFALGVNNSIRNAAIDMKEEIERYTSSMIFLQLSFWSIIFIVSNIVLGQMTSISAEQKMLINILLLYSFANAIVELFMIYNNVNLKYKIYLLVSFFISILGITLSIFFIKSTEADMSYMGRIIGNSIPTILVAVICIIYYLNKGKCGYKRKYWGYGLRFGLPMIMFYLANNMLNSFDRVMIKNMVGESEAGIYSFSYNIANILQIFFNSIFLVWIPWFYAKFSEGRLEEIKKKQALFICGITGGAIMFLNITPELISIMAPDTYGDAKWVTAPICFGIYMVLLYNFWGYTELYLKKTGMLTLGTVLATIVNLLLNYIFIPRYGYVTAAYTTAFSYILLVIFHRSIANKLCGQKLFNEKICWICSLIMGGYVFVYQNLIDYTLIRWGITGILAVVFVGFGYRYLKRQE